MTDARLHPTFLTNHKVDSLGDAEYRVYVNGIVLAASQETDGHLTRRSLRLLHPEPIDLLAVADALVRAGLWEPADGGWSVHDFREYQTSKAQADASREAARLRKAKSRAKSQRDKSDGHGVTPHPVTASDKGQDRDRTGQAKNDAPESPDPWDVNSPPLCAGCGGPMPRDLAEREGWTHHPNCEPEQTSTTRGTAA